MGIQASSPPELEQLPTHPVFLMEDIQHAAHLDAIAAARADRGRFAQLPEAVYGPL